MAGGGSNLAGRRAMVTGGGRGIGRATAAELIRRGADVVIGDLDQEVVDVAVGELGGRASGSVVDVADAESFARFYAAATERGRIDVLINNAGIMPIGGFLEQSAATLHKAIEVNLGGCVNGMRTVLPDMAARGTGHIVNVASTAGKTPVPGGMVYCATKSGVVALTETARVEFADSGVDFTCVLPHFTKTELIAGTAKTRFFPLVGPEDVARGVADALERPRADVYVPSVMGPVMATQPLLGRRLRDRFGKAIGAYDTFLTFDPKRRSAYEGRIAGK
ncbi:SDR family oxidoreductase [Gordonia sp. (in: high G+C Gram-positive bacteria)]|uniref:SDR family oxidoreductase n=1 Tax=Gordonia sp. (in: high G+C Gram-positive bacteria) TaxID=84139 RepID=UPI003F99C448